PFSVLFELPPADVMSLVFEPPVAVPPVPPVPPAPPVAFAVPPVPPALVELPPVAVPPVALLELSFVLVALFEPLLFAWLELLFVWLLLVTLFETLLFVTWFCVRFSVNRRIVLPYPKLIALWSAASHAGEPTAGCCWLLSHASATGVPAEANRSAALTKAARK